MDCVDFGLKSRMFTAANVYSILFFQPLALQVTAIHEAGYNEKRGKEGGGGGVGVGGWGWGGGSGRRHMLGCVPGPPIFCNLNKPFSCKNTFILVQQDIIRRFTL